MEVLCNGRGRIDENKKTGNHIMLMVSNAVGVASPVFGENLGRDLMDPTFQPKTGSMNKIHEIYNHHLRKINGKDNLGWCRTMVHRLGQQLVRQDPVYYCAYVALRGDKRTSLVSYPYYTKYQRPGDSTAFRHLDLNINDLADFGRGAFQLQGSLSLDDEEFMQRLGGTATLDDDYYQRLRANQVNVYLPDGDGDIYLSLVALMPLWHKEEEAASERALQRKCAQAGTGKKGRPSAEVDTDSKKLDKRTCFQQFVFRHTGRLLKDAPRLLALLSSLSGLQSHLVWWVRLNLC
ncbi:hypothetical protein DV738_g1754, partial [Chaetothyriales sp. CBS 135597]